MKNENKFTTSDFWLSITLMTLGEQLLGIDKSSGARATFLFQNSSEIQKKIDDYKNGVLRIEPQKLFIQSKILKNRLYNDY